MAFHSSQIVSFQVLKGIDYVLCEIAKPHNLKE